MKENPYAGLFIAVDGIDRAGKRTQVRNICNHLADTFGIATLATREPWWGKKMPRQDHRLRRAIAHLEKVNPEYIQKLFIDNRKRHLLYEIIPTLGLSGKHAVVTERYFFSTVAYGMATSSLTPEDFYKRQAFDLFMLPDLTIVLDIPVQTALQRLYEEHQEPDVFEKEDILTNVRNNYIELTRLYKDSNVVVIGGDKTPESVFATIRRHVNKAVADKFRIAVESR